MDRAAVLTVASAATAEFTEKKSRFIGQIAPAADEQAAASFVATVRVSHREARHNCYAWIAGENDCSQRSADDGEPAGTAGRPILETLKRAGLSETVLVVTRYFGGVLLGAGGLTRAYARAAQMAVEAATLGRRLPAVRVAMFFDYPCLNSVEAVLARQNVLVENRQYAEKIGFTCLIEQARVNTVRIALMDATKGALYWQELDIDASLFRLADGK